MLFRWKIQLFITTIRDLSQVTKNYTFLGASPSYCMASQIWKFKPFFSTLASQRPCEGCGLFVPLARKQNIFFSWQENKIFCTLAWTSLQCRPCLCPHVWKMGGRDIIRKYTFECGARPAVLRVQLVYYIKVIQLY